MRDWDVLDTSTFPDKQRCRETMRKQDYREQKKNVKMILRGQGDSSESESA